MARALAASDLQALIVGRIARGSGIADWVTPYIVFQIGDSDLQNTMGQNGHNLRITQVDANLYAASSPSLDALENEWRMAFAGVAGPAGGEDITTWITSAHDEPVEQRITDSEARTYGRVLVTQVAFVPAP